MLQRMTLHEKHIIDTIQSHCTSAGYYLYLIKHRNDRITNELHKRLEETRLPRG